MKLEQAIKEFRSWLGRYFVDSLPLSPGRTRHGETEPNIQITPTDENNADVTIWTERHVYMIHLSAPFNGGEGYLGCIASSRIRGQGGNDLADGPFDRDTWFDILADIVGYEALPVRTKKPRPLKPSPRLGGLKRRP